MFGDDAGKRLGFSVDVDIVQGKNMWVVCEITPGGYATLNGYDMMVGDVCVKVSNHASEYNLDGEDEMISRTKIRDAVSKRPVIFTLRRNKY